MELNDEHLALAASSLVQKMQIGGEGKIWSCHVWVEKPRGKYVTVPEINPTFPVIHPLSSFCTS
jgi:hypothetical protein